MCSNRDKKTCWNFLFPPRGPPSLFPRSPNKLLGPFVNPAPPMKPPPHRRPPASSPLKKSSVSQKNQFLYCRHLLNPPLVAEHREARGVHQSWFSSTQNKKKGKMTGVSKRLYCSFLTNCTINKNMRAKTQSPLGLALVWCPALKPRSFQRRHRIRRPWEKERRFSFIDSKVKVAAVSHSLSFICHCPSLPDNYHCKTLVPKLIKGHV